VAPRSHGGPHGLGHLSRGHDPLYLPAIQIVQDSLGRGGKTYVGDVKMAALHTRASLAHSHDYYLCPLSERQLPPAKQDLLIDAALQGHVKLTRIKREHQTPPALNHAKRSVVTREDIAWGYEVNELMRHDVNGRKAHWTERRIIVQSKRYAEAEAAQLDKRLARAEAQLRDGPAPKPPLEGWPTGRAASKGHFLTVRRQGKRRLTPEQVLSAAQKLIIDYRVEGLLSVTVSSSTTTRQIQRYRQKSTRIQTAIEDILKIEHHQNAVKQAKRRKVALRKWPF